MDTDQYLEILGVDLLESQAELIESFEKLARTLGIQLGWHYVLDLAWIASQLHDPANLCILDAGAGTGVLQWWLAERGAHVVSVDRFNRADLAGRYRLAYRAKGLRSEDLYPSWQIVQLRARDKDRSIASRVGGTLRAGATAFLEPLVPKAPGMVTLYRHDLADLPDLEADAFDVVVSVSALEHNAPETLPAVIHELCRILKPHGLLLSTLAAAADKDWLHEPSAGWCLTESTLREAFDLPADAPSNFSDYDSILQATRGSEALRSRLAHEYYLSGDNGMPWGIWDPKYLPVGIRARNP